MSKPNERDRVLLVEIAFRLAGSDSEDVIGAHAIIAAYREEIEARVRGEVEGECAEHAYLRMQSAESKLAEARTEIEKLKARLSDQDAGWDACEHNEPREETRSVDWLNGWDHHQAEAEIERLKAHIKTVEAASRADDERVRHANRKAHEGIKAMEKRAEQAESKLAEKEAEIERLKQEGARIQTAIERCRQGREALFEKAARISRDWQEAESKLAQAKREALEAAATFVETHGVVYGSPSGPRVERVPPIEQSQHSKYIGAAIRALMEAK